MFRRQQGREPFGRAGCVARAATGFAILFVCATGCANARSGPIAFYLDGAGWYAGSGSVKRGLITGGFAGDFDAHNWSAMLGPAHDHFVHARSKAVAQRLTDKLVQARKDDPDRLILVLGLSAGTSVVLNAIEQLPDGVHVDHIVLFSSSASSVRDLTPVMEHVSGRLYATYSRHDGILAGLPVTADGRGGPPAGRVGFQYPRKPVDETRDAYDRVINLPWRPAYMAYDWDGGHTSVTHSDFVAAVIAPRVLMPDGYPLDRSVVDLLGVRARRRTPS